MTLAAGGLLDCPLTVGVEGAAGSNREGIFREL